MLDLKSPVWTQLSHAYGDASGIPAMLSALESFPPNDGYEAPPYYMLWSSLCHQGDIYTASYAAVPHIVRALSLDPSRANLEYFHLPACIEIARNHGRGPQVPDNLAEAYFSALSRIPELAAKAAATSWLELHCRVVVAAIAVAKGQWALGEAILELEPDLLPKVIELPFQ
jgi:hypothetical protein